MMQTEHHMARMDSAPRTREPRFEIVNNPGEKQPWWARFVAANGRIVWTTETYARKGKAIRAIELITGYPVRQYQDGLEVSVPFTTTATGLAEVRLVVES